MGKGIFGRIISKIFREKKQSPPLLKESQLDAIEDKSEKLIVNYSSSRDLYIGFDLGTSCSKVIIRDSITNLAFPINFGELGFETNSFLLPTRLFVSDNILSLKQEGQNNKVIYDLKSNFMNDAQTTNGDFSTDILLTAYLAIAFLFIKKAITESSPIYSKTKINWHINAGAPCLNIKNNSLINKYRKVVLNAWNISSHNEMFINYFSIDANLIIEHLKKIKAKIIDVDNSMKDYVTIFPELFASIKSQISQKRLEKNKMYYMVDIGAGTVDMATFNLFDDKEYDTNYAIFVPTIRNIGSYKFGHELVVKLLNEEIERNRLQEILFSLAEGNKNYDLYNDFGHNVINSDVYCNYEKEYRKQIGETIINTKNNYYPNAQEWREGLPTFMVGGGAKFVLNKIKFYETTLKNKFYELNNYGISQPYLIKSHAPSYFEKESILQDNYYRFLVADGLADDKSNLGKVLSNVRELYNQNNPPIDITSRYISQEMT